MAETSAAETFINGQPGQQNQRQIVGRQAAYIFLWKFVARNAGGGQREIAEHSMGRRFINGNIGDSNRDLLLIRPGVAPQIIVERFITAIKALYIVELVEMTDRNGQLSASWPGRGHLWVQQVALKQVPPDFPIQPRSSEYRPAATPVQGQLVPGGGRPEFSVLL